MEAIPTTAPYLLTDSAGTIVNCNELTSQLAGYKSARQLIGKNYADQQGEISDFACEFIKQDNLVLQSQKPLHFISFYQYADNQFHLLLGKKQKVQYKKYDYVEANYFELDDLVNQQLIQALCETVKTKSKDTPCFWLPLGQEKSPLNPLEQQCARYLVMGLSLSLISQSLNNTAGLIDSITNKLNLTNANHVKDYYLTNSTALLNDAFADTSSLTQLISDKHHFISAFMQSQTIKHNDQKQHLSYRQSECLFYLMRGMTKKEIAYQTNLSPKTVEHYLESVKNKLNCQTRSEIVDCVINLCRSPF